MFRTAKRSWTGTGDGKLRAGDRISAKGRSYSGDMQWVATLPLTGRCPMDLSSSSFLQKQNRMSSPCWLPLRRIGRAAQDRRDVAAEIGQDGDGGRWHVATR